MTVMKDLQVTQSMLIFKGERIIYKSSSFKIQLNTANNEYFVSSFLSVSIQERRSVSGIFAGKYGLITLRDLFRWAERYKKSSSGQPFHDWYQQLAEDGESMSVCYVMWGTVGVHWVVKSMEGPGF